MESRRGLLPNALYQIGRPVTRTYLRDRGLRLELPPAADVAAAAGRVARGLIRQDGVQTRSVTRAAALASFALEPVRRRPRGGRIAAAPVIAGLPGVPVGAVAPVDLRRAARRVAVANRQLRRPVPIGPRRPRGRPRAVAPPENREPDVFDRVNDMIAQRRGVVNATGDIVQQAKRSRGEDDDGNDAGAADDYADNDGEDVRRPSDLDVSEERRKRILESLKLLRDERVQRRDFLKQLAERDRIERERSQEEDSFKERVKARFQALIQTVFLSEAARTRLIAGLPRRSDGWQVDNRYSLDSNLTDDDVSRQVYDEYRGNGLILFKRSDQKYYTSRQLVSQGDATMNYTVEVNDAQKYFLLSETQFMSYETQLRGSSRWNPVRYSDYLALQKNYVEGRDQRVKDRVAELGYSEQATFFNITRNAYVRQRDAHNGKIDDLYEDLRRSGQGITIRYRYDPAIRMTSYRINIVPKFDVNRQFSRREIDFLNEEFPNLGALQRNVPISLWDFDSFKDNLFFCISVYHGLIRFANELDGLFCLIVEGVRKTSGGELEAFQWFTNSHMIPREERSQLLISPSKQSLSRLWDTLPFDRYDNSTIYISDIQFRTYKKPPTLTSPHEEAARNNGMNGLVETIPAEDPRFQRDVNADDPLAAYGSNVGSIGAEIHRRKIYPEDAVLYVPYTDGDSCVQFCLSFVTAEPRLKMAIKRFCREWTHGPVFQAWIDWKTEEMNRVGLPQFGPLKHEHLQLFSNVSGHQIVLVINRNPAAVRSVISPEVTRERLENRNFTDDHSTGVISLLFDPGYLTLEGHVDVILDITKVMHEAGTAYCSLCKKNIKQRYFHSHPCASTQCFLCGAYFSSVQLYRAHHGILPDNDQPALLECPTCHCKCFSQTCLDRHCNGHIYYDEVLEAPLYQDLGEVELLGEESFNPLDLYGNRNKTSAEEGGVAEKERKPRKRTWKPCDNKVPNCLNCGESYVNKQVSPTHSQALWKWEHDSMYCSRENPYKWCHHCGGYSQKKHNCFIKAKARKNVVHDTEKCTTTVVEWDFLEHSPKYYAMSIVTAKNPVADDLDVTSAAISVALQEVIPPTTGESMDEFSFRTRNFYTTTNSTVQFSGSDCLLDAVLFLMGLGYPIRIVSLGGTELDMIMIAGLVTSERFIEVVDLIYPKVIECGGNTISLKMKRLTFIDFSNHIDKPLCRIMTMFGAQSLRETDTLLPIRLLETVGLDYVGPVPSLEAFAMYESKLTEDDARVMEIYYTSLCREYGDNWSLIDHVHRYTLQRAKDLAYCCGMYQLYGRILTNTDLLMKPTLTGAFWTYYLYDHVNKEAMIPLLGEATHEFINNSRFGGRSEVYKSMGEVDPRGLANGTTELIQQVDISGSYPFIMMTRDLPSDHGAPFEGEPDWSYWGKMPMGFAEIEYIPPTEADADRLDDPASCLNIPTLPSKVNGRLEFNMIAGKGVYFMDEILVAKRRGYKIKWIKGYIFQRNSKIFKSYLVHCYTQKVIAEGWVRGSETYNEVLKNYTGTDPLSWYCKELKRRFGVNLTPDQIPRESNDALRDLAKLMSNGIYGRTMPKEYTQTVYCSAETADKLMSDQLQGKVLVQRIDRCGLSHYRVKYDTCKKTARFNGNVAIGCSIAAQGRLRLLAAATQVEDLVHMGVDSLMYEVNAGLQLKTGPFLGDWRLKATISKYVFLGPSSYAYVQEGTGRVEVKIKGIPLTLGVKRKLTIEAMQKVLVDKDEIKCEYLSKVKGKRNTTATTKQVCRTIRPIASEKAKRVVLDDWTTIPHTLLTKRVVRNG